MNFEAYGGEPFHDFGALSELAAECVRRKLVAHQDSNLIKRNRVPGSTNVHRWWERFINGLKSAFVAVYLLSAVGKNMQE
jgi:hypothetical protein